MGVRKQGRRARLAGPHNACGEGPTHGDHEGAHTLHVVDSLGGASVGPNAVLQPLPVNLGWQEAGAGVA